MGGLSNLRIFSAPILLTGLMVIFAVVASSMSGVDGIPLLRPYIGAGLAITFLSALIWMFLKIAKMAFGGVEHPMMRVSESLKDRWKILIFPALLFPIFLAAYTTAKMSIVFLVGFGWDQFWADVDAALIGGDPWRITHAVFGPAVSAGWAWAYSVGWGLTLFFCAAFVSLFGEQRQVAVYFTAMIASWLIGGVLMAYGTPAAGPVFAHLFEPALTDRFEPLRSSLNALLPVDSSIRTTQAYLASSANSALAVKAGGISAMPSMHLAACTIYVMAAIGTRWLVPALLFWLVIFVGSIHFGYHYAIDGIAAAAISVPCWRLAEAFYSEPLATAPASTECHAHTS